jgi:hypothetical protein
VIVERVEQDRDVVVVEHVERVAPHLAGDAAIGLGLVHARADVDVLVVEEDPGLGLLRGGCPFARLLLHEVRERCHRGVDLFGQRPVEREIAEQTHRAHGGLARGLARHHDLRLSWRRGRRRGGISGRHRRGVGSDLRADR